MGIRKIAVVTGSRADYGLLVPLLRLLEQDPQIELQLIACAAHLSPEFGLTKHFIEDDGFTITAEVEMDISSDTPAGIARSMGLGCIGFGETFARISPDLVVLLGDRFETLSAAQAAMLALIPIAHLHGGELTEGLIDEAIRHSITKMSHLHFVAAKPFHDRVVQLGEAPARVFTVGAIGLDNLLNNEPMTKDEVASALGVELTDPLFLVTYHPVTLSGQDQAQSIRNMFMALDHWPNATVVITYSNSDTFGRALIAEIEHYATSNPGRVVARPSLGLRLYLSTMRIADCVVGNSSSGIIEAPSAGLPTVNIGPRQQGRVRAPSVIDCDDETESIVNAIEHALSPAFRKQAAEAENPYGDGKTAARIHQVLRDVSLENILMKPFFDLPKCD